MSYSRSLRTYQHFQYEDAIDELKHLKPFKESVHREMMERMDEVQRIPNPSLEYVASILQEECTNYPSKGIIFVQEIKHTKYIKNWIKNCPDLSEKVHVASISSHSRGEMKPLEQSEIIEDFHRGKYNLLVSTSVLDEGLDVHECNFVICYHKVSNEIAQTQVEGRARAPGSSVYKVGFKYRFLENEEKLRIACKATEEVGKCASRDLTENIHRMQKEFIKKRDIKTQEKEKLQRRWPDTANVEFLCKCGVLACKGSEVFAYTLSSSSEPHYVVPGEAFTSKYRSEKHDDSNHFDDFVKCYRIFCLKCGNQWGNIMKWNDTGFQFPVLSCKHFLFRYGDETKTIGKWKKVCFEVMSIQDSPGFEDDTVDPSD